MHHSDVIKLVEKFLADPKGVSAEELKVARRAAEDTYDAWAARADYAAYWAAAAAYWAASSGTHTATENWTTEARQRIAEYHELTKDSN
jgi:hypothetical protein